MHIHPASPDLYPSSACRPWPTGGPLRFGGSATRRVRVPLAGSTIGEANRPHHPQPLTCGLTVYTVVPGGHRARRVSRRRPESLHGRSPLSRRTRWRSCSVSFPAFGRRAPRGARTRPLLVGVGSSCGVLFGPVPGPPVAGRIAPRASDRCCPRHLRHSPHSQVPSKRYALPVIALGGRVLRSPGPGRVVPLGEQARGPLGPGTSGTVGRHQSTPHAVRRLRRKRWMLPIPNGPRRPPPQKKKKKKKLSLSLSLSPPWPWPHRRPKVEGGGGDGGVIGGSGGVIGGDGRHRRRRRRRRRARWRLKYPAISQSSASVGFGSGAVTARPPLRTPSHSWRQVGSAASAASAASSAV